MTGIATLAPRGENGEVTELGWATMDTPVGPLSLACSATGLARISFLRRSRESRPPAAPPGAANTLLSAARDQLAEYFSGQRRAFDLPIDWYAASRTQQQVLSVLFETVGYGDTITYGSLARRAGLGDGGPDLPARAVGTIMGSNPWPLIVPCHRVVAGNGLGGYSGGTGIEIKRWLLIFEGALPATLDWDPACAHGI
jgi:methylated-DNA-[protein]-cysteine S-methyltransferase